MKTPKTNAFLESYDGCHVVPQSAINFARELECENTRLREALHEIAAFDDVGGCEALKNCGSYGMFDEPVSVQIARAALAVTPSC